MPKETPMSNVSENVELNDLNELLDETGSEDYLSAEDLTVLGHGLGALKVLLKGRRSRKSASDPIGRRATSAEFALSRNAYGPEHYTSDPDEYTGEEGPEPGSFSDLLPEDDASLKQEILQALTAMRADDGDVFDVPAELTLSENPVLQDCDVS